MTPSRLPAGPEPTTLSDRFEDREPRFPDSLLISAPFRHRGRTLGGTAKLNRAQLEAAQQRIESESASFRPRAS